MRFWDYLRKWIKLAVIAIIGWNIFKLLLNYVPGILFFLGQTIAGAGPCLLIFVGIVIVIKSAFK